MRSIFLVVLLLSAADLTAQENRREATPTGGRFGEPALPVAPEVRTTLNDFFQALASQQVDAGYDKLVEGSKIAEKKTEVSALKSKTKEAIRLFGEIRGYELVSVDSVGTRLITVSCLSLGADFPLRWRFYFYRPVADWKLVDIRVDDRLGEMFGERSQTEAKSWPQ